MRIFHFLSTFFSEVLVFTTRMSEPNSNPGVSAAAVTSGDQEGRRLTWDTQMDLMMLRLVRSMPNCFLRKSRTNEEVALLLSQR